MWFIISADYSIARRWRVFRILQHKGQIRPCQDIFLSSHDIQDPPVDKKMCCYIIFNGREHYYLVVRDDCTYLEMVQQIFGDCKWCTDHHFWHILWKKTHTTKSEITHTKWTVDTHKIYKQCAALIGKDEEEEPTRQARTLSVLSWTFMMG